MKTYKRTNISPAAKKRRRFTQDTLFDLIVSLLLAFIICACAYPIWFVLVASFSDPAYVNTKYPMRRFRKGSSFLDRA